MMISNSTYAVQSFIRTVAWVLFFLLFFLVLMVPFEVIAKLIFGVSNMTLIPALILAAWLAGIFSKMFYILPEWERMVLLRLGSFEGIKGPGFFVIPPFIYSVAAIVDTRIETHQVEATATLTKDNVPTRVTAAVEFRVEDPKKSVIDVQNYRQSVIWLSTEALKNTIGSMDLKDLLSERDQIAESLKNQIDSGAGIYGVDVRAVRITDIDTPPSLVEELAVIARERRAAEAKQVQADAEVKVAEKISQASDILSRSPHAMHLRELQYLGEMSKEESSMVIIYPYGDNAGKMIASSAAGRGIDHKSMKESMKNDETVE